VGSSGTCVWEGVGRTFTVSTAEKMFCDRRGASNALLGQPDCRTTMNNVDSRDGLDTRGERPCTWPDGRPGGEWNVCIHGYIGPSTNSFIQRRPANHRDVQADGLSLGAHMWS